MFQTTQKNSSELWHNQNVVDNTRQRRGKNEENSNLWQSHVFIVKVLELFVEEGGNVYATWSKQFKVM